MTAYTDVTGHQVDVYFLGRQIVQQAADTNQTTSDTTATGR